MRADFKVSRIEILLVFVLMQHKAISAGTRVFPVMSRYTQLFAFWVSLAFFSLKNGRRLDSLYRNQKKTFVGCGKNLPLDNSLQLHLHLCDNQIDHRKYAFDSRKSVHLLCFYTLDKWIGRHRKKPEKQAPFYTPDAKLKTFNNSLPGNLFHHQLACNRLSHHKSMFSTVEKRYEC